MFDKYWMICSYLISFWFVGSSKLSIKYFFIRCQFIIWVAGTKKVGIDLRILDL